MDDGIGVAIEASTESTGDATSEATTEAGAGDSTDETTESAPVKLPSLEDVVPPTEAPPDGATQHSLCMPSIREPVAANTRYYCLPGDWLKRWQQYATKLTHSAPPMIDNSPLIAEITADIVLVKRDLTPSADYEIIPEVAWKHFVTWYATLEAS